jgi:hypothetical protein
MPKPHGYPVVKCNDEVKFWVLGFGVQFASKIKSREELNDDTENLLWGPF